jgi:hypothetical protein
MLLGRRGGLHAVGAGCGVRIQVGAGEGAYMLSVSGRNEIMIVLLSDNNAIEFSCGPSVFRRNLQCQPVGGVDTREECYWSHACSLQAEQMCGNQWNPRVQKPVEKRAPYRTPAAWLVAKGDWLLEKEAHRTVRTVCEVERVWNPSRHARDLGIVGCHLQCRAW